MTMLPSVTSTFLPSSSISTICQFSPGSGLGGRLRDVARDQGLELVAEMLDHGAHRHGRCIAERADGAALDVVGHGVQQVHVGGLALPPVDAVHHAPEPARALAARRALAAGFMHVEVREALE